MDEKRIGQAGAEEPQKQDEAVSEATEPNQMQDNVEPAQAQNRDMTKNADFGQDNAAGKTDEFLHSFMNVEKKGDSEKLEDEASMIGKLWQTENNMGMRFDNSRFENLAVTIHNNLPPNGQAQKEARKNLLGAASRKELLEWCAEHYQDMYFSMLLAVCILDRQPYQAIAQMSGELHGIILDAYGYEETEKASWNFKTEISEVLGIVEYTDFTEVRGMQVEAPFLRLQVHEQAEQCMQMMVSEFSELKAILTQYLIDKINKVYYSGHNYMLISGCIEALACIGETDIQYLDKEIIRTLLRRKATGMDFCLSMLLRKMYRKSSCRKFVITCVEQWARLKNEPHRSLTALYVCSMLGGQEMLVCDIWMNILDSLIDELLEENSESTSDGTPYLNVMKELFESGNRNVSYYKGVIHAFYKQIIFAAKNRMRERQDYLGVVFLMLLLDDYACCRVSGHPSAKRRDMAMVSIFKKLDEKTGKELTYLWKLALDNRIYQKEGWAMLEAYLSEFEEYGDQEVEKLAFFFYHINQQLGRDQALLFLKRCAERRKHPVKIAGRIYRRIKE